VCDLAFIRYELECSLEWLAVDDNRELTAKVWLLDARYLRLHSRRPQRRPRWAYSPEK
jgi:hypothetical protein